MTYFVEDHENGPLRANGADGGPPRTDKQPLLVTATSDAQRERHEGDAPFAVAGAGAFPDVAYALADGSGNRTGSGQDGQDTLVVAAPLSHGSNPNSNMAGRRREDDYNLVAVPLEASDGHHGYSSPRGDGADNLIASGFYATGGAHGLHGEQDTSPPLKVGTGLGVGSANAVQAGASVRRLTPTECERLQALPDHWTQLGNTPDSKRYAALGDAVTSTVAEWIGRRIINA